MLQRTYFLDRLAGKYFQLAAFVMLVYDHSRYFFLAVQATRLTSALSVLTFFQEVGGCFGKFWSYKKHWILQVERIWHRRFSLVTLLFLINRYGTLMQFIIVLTGEWRNDIVYNCQMSLTLFGIMMQLFMNLNGLERCVYRDFSLWFSD